MLDSQAFSPTPPTPHDVLKILVDIYGPTPDPEIPFHDPVLHSRRKLASDVYAEAYGKESPSSQMVDAWERYTARPLAPISDLEELKSLLEAASAQMLQSIEDAIEYLDDLEASFKC